MTGAEHSRSTQVRRSVLDARTLRYACVAALLGLGWCQLLVWYPLTRDLLDSAWILFGHSPVRRALAFGLTCVITALVFRKRITDPAGIEGGLTALFVVVGSALFPWLWFLVEWIADIPRLWLDPHLFLTVIPVLAGLSLGSFLFGFLLSAPVGLPFGYLTVRILRGMDVAQARKEAGSHGHMPFLLSIAALLGLLTGTRALGRAFPPPPPYKQLTLDDYQGFQMEGEPVVDAIETYFAEHGRYPANLKLAEIEVPEQAYGGWRYEAREGGRSCQLHLGEYGQHLFVVYWTPEGGWYTDH